MELDADDVIRGERVEIPGWVIADDVTLSVAVDTEIDPELSSEDGSTSHPHVNTMRKDAGLELTDRIVLTLPDGDDLLRHEDWIKAETLATRIERGNSLGIVKA